MDKATILGILIGVGGIIIGNSIEGGHFDSLIQGAAAVIVFGGTFGATLVSNKMEDIALALQFGKQAFFGSPDESSSEIAREIIQSAQKARIQSVLSIERKISQYKNSFLRNTLRYVVDGADEKVIRRVFETEIYKKEEKWNAAAKVWTDAGGFAPTIGIIGAVLGLIQVMANLTDTSELGKGIAVAFVATVYGVGSANLLFIPIANKIKGLIADRVSVMEMILDGVCSISKGHHPQIVKDKIGSYIDVSQIKIEDLKTESDSAEPKQDA